MVVSHSKESDETVNKNEVFLEELRNQRNSLKRKNLQSGSSVVLDSSSQPPSA